MRIENCILLSRDIRDSVAVVAVGVGVEQPSKIHCFGPPKKCFRRK